MSTPPPPEPHANPAIALRVDARGLRCPLPVLRARKVLAEMAPGAVLAIEADDPLAAIDLPHFCTEAGHTLLDMQTAPDGARCFVIRRGG